jgi:kynurenine formamidase
LHFGNGRQSLEQIPPERLYGPGVVIDVRDKVKVNPDYAVTVDDILGEVFSLSKIIYI